MTFQDWAGVIISLVIFTSALGLIGWVMYLITKE